MTEPLHVSKQTARRFVLGRQGLWPGRRWSGLEGLADALRTIEALQLDPLNILARSHDIALYGRVAGYRPEHLDELMYGRRQFFDYGGALFVYPMSELPYWWRHMESFRTYPRWRTFAEEHPHVLEQVRSEIRSRGPLGNRDFEGNKRVNSYRGRKDTGLALWYLWATGELMVHHRAGFERVYDFRENVAPPKYDHRAADREIDEHFARKTLAFLGLARLQSWRVGVASDAARPIDKPEAAVWMERLLAQGMTARVKVEDAKEVQYVLAEDLPLLQTLEAGRVPQSWRAPGTTTEEEVVFLAPLDIVSARGRAAVLFDFDYVWEVYKPAHERRWGYYTLPILWGDRLVARIDARMERPLRTFRVLNFWPEPQERLGLPRELTAGSDFIRSFARGLARFARFTGAEQTDAHVLEWLPQELLAREEQS